MPYVNRLYAWWTVAVSFAAVICILSAWSCQARELDYSFSLELSERVYVDLNTLDQSILIGADAVAQHDLATTVYHLDEVYNVLSLTPSLALNPYHTLSGNFTCNVEWLAQDNTPENEIDLDLLEAQAVFSKNPLQITLGLQHFKFGNSFVFDGYEPGACLEVRWGRSRIIGKSALIKNASPLAEVLVHYPIFDFGKIEAFITGFSDKDDLLGGAYATEVKLIDAIDNKDNLDAIVQDLSRYISDLDNQGELFWYGLTVETLIGDLFFSGDAIWQSGSIDYYMEISDRRTFHFPHRFTAWLTHLQLDYNLSSTLSGGLFAYLIKGDDEVYQTPMQQPDAFFPDTFLSVSRYIPYGLIFFGNGYWPLVSDSIYFQRDPWNGVLAPGFVVDYRPYDRFSIGANATAFYTQAESDSGRDWYGLEFDLLINYALSKDISLSCTTAYFRQGTWYPNPPDDIFSISLGIDFFYNL